MLKYVRIGTVRKGATLEQVRAAFPMYAACLVLGPLQTPDGMTAAQISKGMTKSEIPNSMLWGVWVPEDQYDAHKGKIIKPKLLQLLAYLGSLWSQFRQSIKSFRF
jgi:hypothetical protein